MNFKALILVVFGVACGQEPVIDPAFQVFVDEYTKDGRIADVSVMGFAGPVEAENMRDSGQVGQCQEGGIIDVEPQAWQDFNIEGQRIAVSFLLDACTGDQPKNTFTLSKIQVQGE